MELYDTRQINYCQKEFRRLVESFCQYAEGTSRVRCSSLKHPFVDHYLTQLQSIIAVKPLKKALLRTDSSLFSFMHTIFTRICLKAKCYRDAIQVLDIDIFDSPPSRSAKDADLRGFELLSHEVMEYYLYGAQLYMGVKNWRRAQDFLSQVRHLPDILLFTILILLLGNCFPRQRVLSDTGRGIQEIHPSGINIRWKGRNTGSYTILPQLTTLDSFATKMCIAFYRPRAKVSS
jgi:hypothetical protein